MARKLTDNTKAYTVTLANGHELMPLADSMEDACIMASAEGLLEFGVGDIASVKNDQGRVYGDVTIKVRLKFLKVK